MKRVDNTFVTEFRAPARVAVFMWTSAYVVSMILTIALVGGVASLLDESVADVDSRAWAVGLGAVALWAPALGGIYLLCREYGSRDIRRDLAVTFVPRDVVGVAIGVASQLLLVGLVTWPFTKIFPDTFSQDKVEQRAQDLLDGAKGAWVLILVVVVVIGAPIMEELMYRGVLQTSIARAMNSTAAWFIVATWFALIHMSPVEIPGLLAFALVLGYQRRRTGRLGLCIVTHAAFNATGLLILLGS